MITREKILHLKSCCFALGLTKKNESKPYAICGTGFIIDSEGYFVTAEHVVDGMESILKREKSLGNELEHRGFLFKNIDDEHGQLTSIKIDHGRNIEISIPELGDNIPLDHDFTVGRLSGKHNLPFLKFDKPTKIDVYDEIIMCGYPGGSLSLRTSDYLSGNRYSPVLQSGHVSSLFPTDYSKNPYGIQTDIIGTGGSSGSPIIDANSEQVIGIAQKVITADVNVGINTTYASAKIGLVWGISNYFITDALQNMLAILKKEFDKNGVPLSNDELPETVKLDGKFIPPKFD
ncbi:hypothetical protein C6988_02450 [Nitrosopumilus sp. b1]|uniref:S1 family peptidase n=1 Tax=Nitrosopumilus sp. b1 TaxID=2109907 RepID=UPI0015F4BEA6|nr:serine protease [Nitrosopumilus sp. b1]KAF6243623.1 hypothetical protein C6988_02450 [Nitrosopumilus sp. b1]